MRAFLRKCRGILGVAITWGAVWGAVFATLAFIVGIIDPDSIDPGETPLRIAGLGAVFGVVSGVAFGVLLAVAEGKKTLRDLSLARVALWGAVASAVFPLLTPVDNSMLVIVCPIGAALAAGLVAVAKKGALAAPHETPQ
jgi:uncharacterized membrane protein